MSVAFPCRSARCQRAVFGKEKVGLLLLSPKYRPQVLLSFEAHHLKSYIPTNCLEAGNPSLQNERIRVNYGLKRMDFSRE